MADTIDSAPVRLTQHTRAGGCASKLAPGTLAGVLSQLPAQQHPDLLVGFESSDDAGVFRLGPEQALVQTVDFFTPMVDDPFTFGRIAATNALSDVYAMGGKALTALALVCYPPEDDPAVLREIMRGGLSTMGEASCLVIGGHSVRDAEIKFGYAVTGLVHPDRVLKNTGARPGDALVFTKALGTGVITTALKQGRAEDAWVEAAVGSMTTLNQRAAEVLASYNVHAATDVTGFGLMGHAREVAVGSGVTLVFDTKALALLPGARAAVEQGSVPAGLLANRDYAECLVKEASAKIDSVLRTLLFDPQTAGGLLLAVRGDEAEALAGALRGAGYPHAAVVGEVVAGAPKLVLR